MFDVWAIVSYDLPKVLAIADEADPGCLPSVGSMWSLARTANEGFVIFAGCMMGVGAADFWAAQGVIVMSYPLEAERAKYFSYQYFLLTLGACIGGFVALADTIMHDRQTRISDAT
jgi:hypothetical protein